MSITSMGSTGLMPFGPSAATMPSTAAPGVAAEAPKPFSALSAGFELDVAEIDMVFL